MQTTVSAGNLAALASISVSNVDFIIYDPNTKTVTVVTTEVLSKRPQWAPPQIPTVKPYNGYDTAPPPTLLLER